MATYLPSEKPSKSDEQDKQDVAGETRRNTLETFFFGPLCMNIHMLADQQNFEPKCSLVAYK